MKATTNKADFATSEQIKKIFNAKELAGWIKSHLKMRYRVPFFADGYGVAWIVPNTSGDTLIASGGAFLDALAEHGGATKYIDKAEGDMLFESLMTSNSLKEMDYIEVTLCGVRFVFGVWTDWWTLRGLSSHI